MPTIAQQLTQLTQDRNNLVTNLTTKGITGLTGDETFTELVPEVLNIPSGSAQVEAPDNDVIFIDYDGTRLYSYSASDFDNLTEMPANPTHDGLTSLGWNWSLADAKEYVSKYGMIVIGQLYKTTDGSTKIYIELEQESVLDFYLRIGVRSSATIDWGDGDTTSTSGILATLIKRVYHHYSSVGKYTIKITPASGSNITISSPFLGMRDVATESDEINSILQKCIKKN